MARTSGRSAEEVEGMLTEYEKSGLSRRQYCEQQGIPITTFDYHRRRRRQRGERTPAAPVAQLVKVELEVERPGIDDREVKGFTLELAKGRRIESGWNYAEQDLARLIRIVEAV